MPGLSRSSAASAPPTSPARPCTAISLSSWSTEEKQGCNHLELLFISEISVQGGGWRCTQTAESSRTRATSHFSSKTLAGLWFIKSTPFSIVRYRWIRFSPANVRAHVKFSVVDVRGDHTNSKVRSLIIVFMCQTLVPGSFCSNLNKKALFKILTVKSSN